jgi:Sulfotransferase family
MAGPPIEQSDSGPDFICIGAQKAGTGWLYEQLRNHPDFWMPPMKELHYFDRFGSTARTGTRSLPVARQQQERIAIARQRSRDDRDEGFLDRFEKLAAGSSSDFSGYSVLFQKGNQITGDITPGYSSLGDAEVAQIISHFPAVKIIFIARDPVERAWSQISMYVRRGLVTPFAPEDVKQITEHLQRPEIRSRSFPSEIVTRWRRQLPVEQFALYFFDDLKRDSTTLRARVITFLGGDPHKKSGELPPGYNPKAQKQKLNFSESARRHVAEFFESELKRCATELGGPAADWPNRYGF